ncbi:hypothetical protein IAT40_000084 [Kwoniella sp. CBS 6097]
MTLLMGGIALLICATLRVEAQTFVGCSTIFQRGQLDPAPVDRNTEAECLATCQETRDTSPYMYYQPSTLICVCSDISPPVTILTPGDSAGNCDASRYHILDLTTSFDFQGCYTDMVTDSAPASSGTLQSCFASCASVGSAMFYPNSATGNFDCRCNDAYTIDPAGAGGSSTNCGPNAYFTYTHSPDASASGLARRKIRARLEQLRLEKQAPCPRGMTACSLEGSADAYECIDTRSELESCGGCMYGVYQDASHVNGTAGINCATLEGVTMGGATCRHSSCEAYACKEGYGLVSGECVSLI